MPDRIAENHRQQDVLQECRHLSGTTLLSNVSREFLRVMTSSCFRCCCVTWEGRVTRRKTRRRRRRSISFRTEVKINRIEISKDYNILVFNLACCVLSYASAEERPETTLPTHSPQKGWTLIQRPQSCCVVQMKRVCNNWNDVRTRRCRTSSAKCDDFCAKTITPSTSSGKW